MKLHDDLWLHLTHEVGDHSVEGGPLEVQRLAGLANPLLACSGQHAVLRCSCCKPPTLYFKHIKTTKRESTQKHFE